MSLCLECIFTSIFLTSDLPRVKGAQPERILLKSAFDLSSPNLIRLLRSVHVRRIDASACRQNAKCPRSNVRQRRDAAAAELPYPSQFLFETGLQGGQHPAHIG